MSDITFVGDDMHIVGNNEEFFDESTMKELKCYVYALTDPRDKKVFYVGKAGGKAEEGNNRIFSHFKAAQQVLAHSNVNMDQKTRRIIEIWSADEQVDWYIVRHGLNEETALHVEAALIDLLGVSQNGPALNLVRGHHTYEHGILTPDMVQEFRAKLVAPTVDYPAVFIFPVQNAIAQGEGIYLATRKAWSVSEDLRKMKGAVAVGIVNGIAKGVFEVDEWQEYEAPQPGVGAEKAKDDSAAAQGRKGRTTHLWEFKGTPLNGSELLNRNFSAVIARAMGYWQRGNYLVIKIVKNDGNPPDKTHFRFLRGNRDKQAQIEF